MRRFHLSTKWIGGKQNYSYRKPLAHLNTKADCALKLNPPAPLSSFIDLLHLVCLNMKCKIDNRAPRTLPAIASGLYLSHPRESSVSISEEGFYKVGFKYYFEPSQELGYK